MTTLGYMYLQGHLSTFKKKKNSRILNPEEKKNLPKLNVILK
jgi:hypothetical protein